MTLFDETAVKSEAICPICKQRSIVPPHGVCDVCRESAKQRFYINGYGMDEWEKDTVNGLSAAYLATIIVDESPGHDSFDFAWLRREAFFLCDLIRVLPSSLFQPVSHEQMENYLNKAADYWNGSYDDVRRKAIRNDFESLLDKQTAPSTWDVKSLPLWVTEIPDTELFDWMLMQFMDCIYNCVSKGQLSDNQWMTLFQMHFSKEIESWIVENKKV